MAKTMMTAQKRTGLRKPKHFLKSWGVGWPERLTPRLTVGMVDEWLAEGTFDERKSWYLSITQDVDLLKTLGPVKGVPKKGKTLLLFEDDVVALVKFAAEADLVHWDGDDFFLDGDEPSPSSRERLLKRTAAKRPAPKRSAGSRRA